MQFFLNRPYFPTGLKQVRNQSSIYGREKLKHRKKKLWNFARSTSK